MADVTSYLDNMAGAMDLVERLIAARRESLDGAVMVRVVDDEIAFEPVSLVAPSPSAP